MSTIFDLDAVYNEGSKNKYSQKELARILAETGSEKRKAPDGEYVIKRALEFCKELCPSSMEENSRPKDSKKRFERLQFLYYMIIKEHECRNKGFSLSNVIRHPSERYLDLYNEMISDIQEKVSKPVLESCGPIPGQSDKEPYVECIHAIQEYVNTIAATLRNMYDGFLDRLHSAMKQYCEHLQRLTSPAFTNPNIENYWDELYLRLNYAKHAYWESDLLESFSLLQEITDLQVAEDHPYSAMLKESEKRLCEEDYVPLDLKGNCELSEEEIIEKFKNPLDPNLETITQYIKENLEDIAKKVFCKSCVTKNDKKKIRNRISKIDEYYRMEKQRYTRNSLLTIAKIVSAYQAFFLSQPKSGLAPTKKGTVKATTPSGLRREKNTLSASYSNSGEKEPSYLQLICTWTDYRHVWNDVGEYYAEQYLLVNTKALEALTAMQDDYWQAGTGAFQMRAEEVLFAAMDTLIPYEDGKENLGECMRELHFPIVVRRQKYDSISQRLIQFGKFCKLFSLKLVCPIVEQAIRTPQAQYEIPLNGATENAVRLYQPTLHLVYDEIAGIYEMISFDVKKP